MNELLNKSVIVTGAGAGMGKAIAMRFAREGAKVLAADVRSDRLEGLVKEAGEKTYNVTPHKADMTVEAEVTGMVEKAASAHGGIDILVNNAGIMDDFMPAGDATTELWRRVMAVNLDAPFFACRAAIAHMLGKGGGCIINIASVGGLHGSRAGAAYTASKHALIGLTKNIGYMYALKGIRCNAIAPGGVNTSIGETMRPNQFGYERMSLGMQSNPRMGEPAEIAELALFLATQKSSFINGAVITADAGWTAY